MGVVERAQQLADELLFPAREALFTLVYALRPPSRDALLEALSRRAGG